MRKIFDLNKCEFSSNSLIYTNSNSNLVTIWWNGNVEVYRWPDIE